MSNDIKKPWIKEIQKETKTLFNNQNFIVEDKNEGKPVIPCMDVYKAKFNMMGFLTSSN